MMTIGDVGRGDVTASLAKLEELANKVLVSLGQEVDLGDLVAQEMQVMDQQIEEAAARIEQLLEESRRKHTGAQLEVNSKVLDSCTELVRAIRELVMRSKALQKEIVEERGLAQGQTDKEFYRKNRYTLYTLYTLYTYTQRSFSEMTHLLTGVRVEPSTTYPMSK